jgi:hypothetical protein
MVFEHGQVRKGGSNFMLLWTLSFEQKEKHEGELAMAVVEL